MKINLCLIVEVSPQLQAFSTNVCLFVPVLQDSLNMADVAFKRNGLSRMWWQMMVFIQHVREHHQSSGDDWIRVPSLLRIRTVGDVSHVKEHIEAAFQPLGKVEFSLEVHYGRLVVGERTPHGRYNLMSESMRNVPTLDEFLDSVHCHLILATRPRIQCEDWIERNDAMRTHEIPADVRLQAFDDFIGAPVDKAEVQNGLDVGVDDDLKEYIVDQAKWQGSRLACCQYLANAQSAISFIVLSSEGKSSRLAFRIILTMMNMISS